MKNTWKFARIGAALLTTLFLAIAPGASSMGEARDTSSANLPPLPSGLNLAVVLTKTLTGGKTGPGTPVTAKTMQRVLLPQGAFMHGGAKLKGIVVSSTPSALEIRFSQLIYRGRAFPLSVRLLAAASYMTVQDAELPLSPSDRAASSPADWTTRQIGGDEVYRSAGSGPVYNRYSEKIGYADLHGVYAYAEAPEGAAMLVHSQPGGPLPLSMGIFSSSASGLYGMPHLRLTSDGAGQGGSILFTSSAGRAKLNSGDALLLRTLR
ncbi:MAG TPA: hypothetical protein VGR96_00795 [Acidobacteriaceae bacterium]|nr:hypothetical protein [Acidobacteriaceae bacterium]